MLRRISTWPSLARRQEGGAVTFRVAPGHRRSLKNADLAVVGTTLISLWRGRSWSPQIMPTSSAARVLHRFLSAASPRRKTAAVVLTDSPPGWDWGWFGNVDPPLHIEPMKAGHRNLGRVYLEDGDGRRVFRPEGRIPAEVLSELAREVDLHDVEIEDAWAYHAVIRGWIEPVVEPDQREPLLLRIYAGTSSERTRQLRVNWNRIIGGRRPTPADVVIDAEAVELVVGARVRQPVRIPLRHVVFNTQGAVINGVTVAEHDWGRELHAQLHRVLKKLPSDFTPYGQEVRDGKSDCSSGCRFYIPMAPPLQEDWGVCSNPAGPRAGLLTFEHQGCAGFEKGFVPIRPPT